MQYSKRIAGCRGPEAGVILPPAAGRCAAGDQFLEVQRDLVSIRDYRVSIGIMEKKMETTRGYIV